LLQAIEPQWLVFPAAVLLLLGAGWLLRSRSGRVRSREYQADVLDNGADSLLRNQTLIDSAPAVPPQPRPELAEPGGKDDLSRIKGLGPRLQALLPTLGLASYSSIASLTEADLAELDTKLGIFAGRPAKDNWVEQARYLAAGDLTGFEDRFGRL